MGESALTWTLRRGYTPIVETLKAHGASDRALVQQSVEKAVALLQKSGPEFVKVSGCTSCHHQSLPQMAYALARERGFAVDPQISEKQRQAVIGGYKPYREQMEQDKISPPDPAIGISFALVGLAAEGYAPDQTTAAMAHLISRQQNKDGSFRALTARPPIEGSVFTAAALSIRALQTYGVNPGQSVERARQWLRTANPHSTEDRAMQLLGLTWSKSEQNDLKKLAKTLIAEQRPDGGWAQSPNLESDSYATGQALVALRSCGQLNATDRAYQRGAAFLLRTQSADGSWLVRSRSFPVQPLKDSGQGSMDLRERHQLGGYGAKSRCAQSRTAGLAPRKSTRSELEPSYGFRSKRPINFERNRLRSSGRSGPRV